MAIRILNENKLRSFNRTDYYSYAGANQLPSGKDPLIASGNTADVVVASGDDGEIFIQLVLEDDGSYSDFEYFKVTDTEESAISIANKIAKYLDSNRKTLLMVAKKFGFKS